MQLYNGDCLEVMKSIPNKSIDLILCDLPYGITKCKWDTPIDLFAMWNQYNRIIKDNAPILLFAQTPLIKFLDHLIYLCLNMNGFGKKHRQQVILMQRKCR